MSPLNKSIEEVISNDKSVLLDIDVDNDTKEALIVLLENKLMDAVDKPSLDIFLNENKRNSKNYVVSAGRALFHHIKSNNNNNTPLNELMFNKVKELVDPDSLSLYSIKYKENPSQYIFISGEALLNNLIVEAIQKKMDAHSPT